MKKLLILLLMVASVFTLGGFQVFAVDQSASYDYVLFDNQKYDLINGAQSSDINYSITNKILIANNTVDNTVYVDNSDFHHVLFFDSKNIYLGYINTSTSDLELSTYLGYDVAENSFECPDNARKFALMNYDYGDTLDTLALGSLTYHDIFGGSLYGSGKTNIIDESFTFDSPLNHPLGNVVYYDSIMVNEFDINFTQISRSGYDNNDVAIANSRLTVVDDTENITVVLLPIRPNTNYFLKANEYNLTIDRMRLYEYDEFPTETLDGTILDSSINPSGEAKTSGTNAKYWGVGLYLNGLTIGDYIGDIQVEEGVTASEYMPYNLDSIISKSLYEIGGISDTDTNQYIGNDYNDVLQSATGWTAGNVLTTTQYFFKDLSSELGYKTPATDGDIGNINLVIGTSVFTTVAQDDNFGNDVEGIVSLTAGGLLVIRANKTTYPNSASFEAYLQANDVKFYYELDTPIANTKDEYYYNWAESLLYNLTDLYDGETISTIEEFEVLLNIFPDPLIDSYTEYHTPVTILLVLPTYLYDDTPPVDSTLTENIQGGLIDIGAISTGLKIFFALAVMVGFAFGLGRMTNSITTILLIEVVLFIVFALLGFFELWLVLLLGLVLVLLIFYKILH